MDNNLSEDNEKNNLLIWSSFTGGSWEAYTEIYNNHFKLLCNYGYKFTKNINLIEDCVHDLFVKLWTNKHNLGKPVSIKNYLFKALRHAIFRKLQSGNKFVEMEETDPESHHFEFEVSFDHHLIAKEEERELQQKMKNILQGLPFRQQEIIYLRFYEGLNYDEIADVMGITVNSTYKLFYKALNNLQEIFKISKLLTVVLLLSSIASDKFFNHNFLTKG